MRLLLSLVTLLLASLQYPGVRNLRTYCMILEDGKWKLDDIYGFNDEFTSAESLLQFFRSGSHRGL